MTMVVNLMIILYIWCRRRDAGRNALLRLLHGGIRGRFSWQCLLHQLHIKQVLFGHMLLLPLSHSIANINVPNLSLIQKTFN